MFDGIKQNSKTIIEISYSLEGLLDKKKNKKKIIELERKMHSLIQDNDKEIKKLRDPDKNAKWPKKYMQGNNLLVRRSKQIQ